MRQRKVKNLSEKWGKVSNRLITEPEKCKGEWRSVFPDNRSIFLEIGCGRGQFLNHYARSCKNRNYIGIEGQSSVLLRAMEKAEMHELQNIRFVSAFVNDLTDYFEDGELDGIYLNFSDPWPKAKHAKRRLTYVDRLKNYKKVLKEGSFIEIKTDNDGLFKFTLEQITSASFRIEEMSDDLHNTAFTAKEVTTEYEDKFRATGKNINYIKIKA